MAWLEAPSPRMKRPGARCDRVAAVAASTAGVRVNTGITPVPMRNFSVRSATAAARVRESMLPPSANHTSSKPSCSAQRA